jgi:gamma-glutamyl:cysteine ligase YbdK (ATP-grasp superfamily)
VTSRSPLRLFEATGIEIEYMIVDRESLAVRPIADELIRSEVGSVESEIERGAIAWSNELALHVVELKTNGPARTMAGLAGAFQGEVNHVNERLASLGAMLMPSGMHPTMDPATEFVRWPHEYGEVYAAFDRIFDCSGHGWANLQSVHVNLPFHGDDEFGRLHAAIRTVLPILPAIAASSPIVEGRRTGLLDSRLDVYRGNARRVPSVSGRVVPEPAFTSADYDRVVLQQIYADLAPHDPAGTLRHDWVNARGCIPRFERGSIEIRLLDVQECPGADLALCAAVVAALRALVEEKWSSRAAQEALDSETLVGVLDTCIRDGDRALVDAPDLLACLGQPERRQMPAGELWESLVERTLATGPDFHGWRAPLEVVLEEGCLARRILRRVGAADDRHRIDEVYRELSACLATGTLFRAPV